MQLHCVVPHTSPGIVVRGTVPVPACPDPGTSASPFTVLDHNQQPCPTQWWVFARHENGSPRAAYVMAYVEDVHEAPGFFATFDVDFNPKQPAPGAGEFAPPGLEAHTLALTTTPEAIGLELVEADGRTYTASLTSTLDAILSGDASTEPVFAGHVMSRYRRSCRMRHGDGAGSLGVQSWLTIQRGSACVFLDLSVDNGQIPDPRGHVGFERLRLTLPRGWGVVPLMPEPQIQDPELSDDGRRQLIDLVQPTGGHLFPSRAQRDWRFVVHPPGARAEAEELASRRGWATCREGWHEHGGYWSTGLETPDLEHCDAQIDGRVTKTHAALWQSLEQEETWQTTKAIHGALGPWRPAGPHYGGVTGGDEINQVDGLEAIQSARPEALLAHMMEAHRWGCRQHDALWTEQGHTPPPTLVGGTAPFKAYNSKFQHGRDPFGFDHAQGVGADASWYGDSLLQWDNVDTQHWVRATGDWHALAWLDADPIGLARAELFGMLAAYEYHTGSNGVLESIRAAANKGHVKANRALGWAIQAATHAYVLGTNTTREVLQGWFLHLLDALESTITPTGLVKVTQPGEGKGAKHLGQQHPAHASQGTCIIGHALGGVHESVPDVSARARVLVREIGRGLADYYWNAAGHGAWFIIAADFPSAPDPVENPTAFPIAGSVIEVDRFHIPNALAMSWRFSHDFDDGTPTELTAAIEVRLLDYCGEAADLLDALTWLESRGLDTLHNRAYLLASLQRVRAQLEFDAEDGDLKERAYLLSRLERARDKRLDAEGDGSLRS